MIYINWDLSHNLLLGSQDRHDLIFCTGTRRYHALSKTFVFETCVSAIVLWNTLFVHPHVASIFPLAFSWDDAVLVTINARFLPENNEQVEITNHFKSQQGLHHSLGSW